MSENSLSRDTDIQNSRICTEATISANYNFANNGAISTKVGRYDGTLYYGICYCKISISRMNLSSAVNYNYYFIWTEMGMGGISEPKYRIEPVS